ncbi:putative nuclease HARBI1 [Macrosteles quadrilineatus]|uniref:putative nuclease HARBI1 n=1 Tax=Macrosteles quadrilineatus TaxID=74068 RepID=UPI0023E18888|nr:putative nuclease HARBI1 [Macrosteles quadrilineatus]
MASGSYQECIGQNRYLGMSQSSVSNCLHSVCDAMEPVLKNYIKFPSSQREMADINHGFWKKYRFPGTIDAIDGTHVAITSPPKNDPEHPEHIYLNRKNFHSINTQIISDSERKILSIWARFPGSSHDAVIWHQSHVKRHLTRLYHQGLRNTWLIGDGDSSVTTKLN